MTQLTGLSNSSAPAAALSSAPRPSVPMLILPSIKDIFSDRAEQSIFRSVIADDYQRPPLSSRSYYPCVKVHPDDCIGQFIWNELKGKPLSTWRTLHMARSAAREPYGIRIAKENPSPKRTVTVVRVQDYRDLSNRERKKRIARIKHAIKEQERRVRHRVLQSYMDKHCSDFHFELGEKLVDLLKAKLGHEETRKCNSTEVGKDLNLTTTLCSLVMANWIDAAQCELIDVYESGSSPGTIIASYDPDSDPSNLLPRNSQIEKSLRLEAHYAQDVSFMDLTPPPSPIADS